MSNNNDDSFVHERNEDSVLFSLNALTSQEKTDQAGSDDLGSAEADNSGFINLNALASSSQYVSGSQEGAPPAPALDLGPKKSNTGMIVAIVVSALLVVAAIVAAIVVLGNKEPEKPQTEKVIERVIIKEQVPAKTDDDDPNDVNPDKAKAAAADDGKDEKKEEETEEARKKREEQERKLKEHQEKMKNDPAYAKRYRERQEQKRKEAAAAAAAKAKEEKANGGSGGGATNDPGKKRTAIPSGSVNDILKDLGGGGGNKAPAETAKKAPEAPAAQGLDRSTIKRVMGGVAGRARACGGPGKSGTVKVRFTITPAGSVGGAAVVGSKAGTPEGNCVLSKVRGAKFPSSGKSMTITYPIILP